VRDSFRAETLSTSNLSAPALALAALDPRVVHSFEVGGHLMVVSPFTAGAALGGLAVRELRDRFGALVLSLRRNDGQEALHPTGETTVQAGELVTLQASYDDYLKLRAFTGEVEPPLSGR
jgi:Trk K+ transport system NAD-binding subunit